MVRVGICSWTEGTLLKSGAFYPSETMTAEERLRFYAQHFDTVEVDSTYYAIPSEANAVLWAERTPENFIFHVKVYGALTGHGINPRTLPQEIRAELSVQELTRSYTYIRDRALIRNIARRFRNSLTPLVKSNKIGLLVYQFPPWFQYSVRHFDLIRERCNLIDDLDSGVEFRHGSWLTERRRESVLSFLREHGLAFIVADEPQYGSMATVPFLPEITTKVSYIRLHGRNRANWLRKGIETSLRYAYEYSEAELKEFIPSISKLKKQAKQTYIMFNNCHLGFAIKNASQMKKMIREIP